MADTVFGVEVEAHIQSSTALRTVTEPPSDRVRNKVIDHLDTLSQRFIAASPLAVVSTRRPDGTLDMTPRGDPPGFAHVLNDRLLAIPDRPGNQRMDTFENLFETPDVGLLFIIPGHNDTLRVSGTGAVVQDAALGERLAVNGRSAKFILLVNVTRVLAHCSKAFVRGRVWQQIHWPDTSDVPTLAELMDAHSDIGMPVDEYHDLIEADAKDRLY